MAIAYINDENIVLHIILSDDERIKPSEDGNTYMTPGKYNHSTFRYDHIFGVGQKVREVPAHGLSIGATYVEPVEVEVSEVDEIEAKLQTADAEIDGILNNLALEYLKESKGFEDWVAKKMAEMDTVEHEEVAPEVEEPIVEENITQEETEAGDNNG